MSQVPTNPFPEHVGIIMDGNGRWASERNHPRTFGHVRGAQIARKIIEASVKAGLKHLTLYAFSTENWLRPVAEVNFLMRLLRRSIEKEKENLFRNRIRFEAVGELEKLPDDLRKTLLDLMRETQNHDGMHLIFAISYGARWEIVEACKSLARRVQAGELKPEEISERIFQYYLQSGMTPDPELIIRTSGESRLSNFLLWQAAYSELIFTETLWPDFSEAEFINCLSNFSQRERRFGALKSDAAALG